MRRCDCRYSGMPRSAASSFKGRKRALRRNIEVGIAATYFPVEAKRNHLVMIQRAK